MTPHLPREAQDLNWVFPVVSAAPAPGPALSHEGEEAGESTEAILVKRPDPLKGEDLPCDRQQVELVLLG